MLEKSLHGAFATGQSIRGQVFDVGLCPVAEDYQKKIMAFKSNYRDISEAKKQATLLRKLIGNINSGKQ